MPEQLRFEQLLGDRAAVHRDEPALDAAAVVVDRARDQLLAGAALARDQHRAVGARDLRHDVEHAAQRAAVADDVLEAVLRAQLALQRAVLGLEATVLDRLLDEPAHHVEVALVERLLEVPERARAQRFDRALGAAEARDDDAGQVGVDLVDLPHQLESVQARHAHVGDDEVEAALRQERERFGASRASLT